jgi:hypothetical protein
LPGNFLPGIGETAATLQVINSISINGANVTGSAGDIAALYFHHRTTANTNGRVGGEIRSVSTNSYTNGVPSTYDADLAFLSALDGVDTEVVRATSNGYLRMAASTGGIQFNGDTAAANALDDYEEGTWTVRFGDNGGNLSATTTTGTYTKIGNVVYMHFYIDNVSTVGLNGSGLLTFTMPFSDNETTGTAFLTGCAGSTAVVWSRTLGSTGGFYKNNTASSFPFVSVSDLTSLSNRIIVDMVFSV